MNEKPDRILEDARACVTILDQEPVATWAEIFVALKLDFWRKHAHGLICSSSHGLDYFRNVVAACEGTLKWDEKGEYGDNFRKMIKEREQVD